MSRWPHSLAPIVRVLSLLLCVSMIVLWLHGRDNADYVILMAPTGGDLGVTSARGTIVFYCTEQHLPTSPDHRWQFRIVSETWGYFHEDFAQRAGENEYDKPAFLRIATYTEMGHKGTLISTRRFLILRQWPLIVLLTTMPLIFLVRRVVRRSHRPGICASCGYDLRGTPQRCPECGTVPQDCQQADRAR